MLPLDSLHSFNNVGHSTRARSFPGFQGKASPIKRVLAKRDALRLDLAKDDLLSVQGAGKGETIGLMVFDQDLNLTGAPLGITLNGDLPASGFDTAPVDGWLTSLGRVALPRYQAYVLPEGDDLMVHKALAPCQVWVVRLSDPYGVIMCSFSEVVQVIHQPAETASAAIIPPPLGEVRDEFTVKRGSAFAYEVRAGEVVQIIDVEGQQCSDFVAFRQRGDAGQTGAAGPL